MASQENASSVLIKSDISSLREEDSSRQRDAEHSQRREGYDCLFIGEIPPDGYCTVCSRVYCNPHQMRCCKGRICARCVEEVKASSKPCPLCNAAEISPVPDTDHMLSLGTYKVNCHNSKEGCEWEGQLSELDSHLNLEPTTEKQLEGCLFSKIKCRYCPKVLERLFVDTHQFSECPKRPYECENCEHSFEDLSQHQSQDCPNAPMTCPNNGKSVAVQHDNHNHDMPVEEQQCEFHTVGCQVELESLVIQERMITQDEKIKKLYLGIVLLAILTFVALATALFGVVVTMQSSQHSVNGIQSIEDQMGFCTFDNCNVKREYTDKEGREEWLHELNIGMEQVQMERREELNSRMEKERRELNSRMEQELHSRMELEQKERHEELNSRMEQELKERREELHSRMEQEQKERREELNSRMEQEQKERRNELDRELEDIMLQIKVYNEAKQVTQQLQEQLRELLENLDQEREMKEKAEENQLIHNADINMLQVRQNTILKHLKMIPHEDILPFEFEMKDFEKHRNNRDLWYSPPFYTDINGYKMCIRVDARGKDERYVSVSLILMAGVADDDLNWPFREDITIELLNQASSSRWNPLSYFRSKKISHAETLKFSETKVMKYNQRVTSGDMAPQGPRLTYFIAHNKLAYDSKEGTQYLKDDTLKFRVSRPVAPIPL